MSALLHALVRQVFPRATDEQCERLLLKVRSSAVWKAPNAYHRRGSRDAVERLKVIVKLRCDGLTLQEIADRVDLTRHRVAQLLKEADV